MLGGQFRPYEDPAVQRTIETAYLRGDRSVEIRVRGTEYIIQLVEPLKQMQKSDSSRVRAVQRVMSTSLPPPSPPAPALPPPHPPPKRAKLSADAAGATGPEAAPAGTASSSTSANKTSGLIASQIETASASNSVHKTSGTSAVLIFAPGAGGATARAMRALHKNELNVPGLHIYCCDDFTPGPGESRWVTMNAGNAANAQHVLAVVATVTGKHPSLPVVLCGASFGNRVIAEVLRTHRDELPPAVANAMIACGYPLNKEGAPDGADPKRPAHMLKLP